MKKWHKWCLWWFQHRPEVLWWFWNIIIIFNTSMMGLLVYVGYKHKIDTKGAMIVPFIMSLVAYYMTKVWGKYQDNTLERKRIEEKYEEAIRNKYEKD